MIVFSNAKINIGLHITHRLSNNYHHIESLIIPIDLFDIIEISVSDTFELICDNVCPEIKHTENLIYKAWELFHRDFGISPVKIFIYKQIPFGAGLGGGSSNAAYVLKALNVFFNLGIENEALKQYAAKLGSDCVFFIENKAALVSNTGVDSESFYNPFSGYWLLLIDTGIHIDTGRAYALSVPNDERESLKNKLLETDIGDYRNVISNDFEDVIFPLNPKLRTIKEQLYLDGAIYASMTGSGSAVYGVFSAKIEALNGIWIGL